MRKVIFSFLCIAVCYVCSAQTIGQLIASGESNLEKNHWEQALGDFEGIIKTQTDNLTYLQKAVIYNHIGFLKLKFLEPQEAERNLNLSLLYHEEGGIPNEKAYANALVNMSMLYLEQVEFDLSRSYAQRALDILKSKLEYTVDYLIARTKLAKIYEEAGSYTLALSIYNESYEKLIAMGNDLSPDFADICSHKGRILILTGDPVEGARFINLSATIYESLGKQYNVQRAESMEDLALFYERMGRYGEAEELLLEILSLKRSIPDEADILIIETLNDLGVMYNSIGRFKEAEKMFNEVVAECEENVGTDHPFYATAKNNLGTIALNNGNYDRAKSMLEDALATYREKFGALHPYYANTLNNLARVERKLGNNTTAESHYKEVLKIDERIFGDDHPNYATTMLNIGILLSGDGRENEAEQYYEKALKIRENALGVNHPAYGSALRYMGIHYLATDNLEKAEVNYRKLVQIQISQIAALFPIMSERERELFYRGVKEEVEKYNYIASQLLEKNPDLIKNIFDFQAQTKTVLFNFLEKIKTKVANSEDDLLKARYSKWKEDKRLLTSYYQMGVQELAELNINLNLVEVEISKQEEVLKESIESFNEIVDNEKLSWEKVLAIVKPGESVIEVVRIKEFKPLGSGKERVYGFTNNVKYLAIIFNGESQDLDYVLLGNANTSDSNYFADYLTGIKKDTKEARFYSTFWQPIMDLVGKAEVIRIIPDGIFNKINPNILSSEKGKYVVEANYVSYITSTYDLFKEDPIVYNQKSYLFGEPDFSGDMSLLNTSNASSSSSELSEVQSVLAPWKVNTYVNDQANEFMVRSAYNPTVLHIALPGYFNNKNAFIRSLNPISNPLFNSGIYLSKAGASYDKFERGISILKENDGVLTSYDVLSLDLNRTQLVVLSGLEPDDYLDTPEGYYGLMRAFTAAGARNIITSLNSLDSKVKAEFLTRFYRKYLETDKIEDSFRSAQLEMKKKYDDPKLWGLSY